MAYVYVHKKAGTDSVYYVGIGGSDKDFKRANLKCQRNNLWSRIFEKYGLEVEVTHTGIIWEEACAIERYLISFYGRLNNKTGVLANLTDGGEGAYGHIKSAITLARLKASRKGQKLTEEHKHKLRKPKKFTKEGKAQLRLNALKGQPKAVLAAKSKEAIEKRITKMKGRKPSLETRQNMSIAHKGKTIGFDNPNSKVVVDTVTGEIFGSISLAAIKYGIKKHTLYRMLKNERKNITNLIINN